MIALIMACFASAAAQIEMRAREAAPPGDLLAVSMEGVTVGFPPAAQGAVGPIVEPVVISWDRVRAVLPPNDKAAEPFRAIAEKAWRARTRVERGDLAGAEPLLEELHATFAGQRGPTASVIGQLLLRCRLARGAQTLAIAPWLTWLGSGVAPRAMVPARRAPKDEPDPLVVSIPSPAALDVATGLVPALAPFWLDGPGVQAFARGKPPLAGTPEADAAPIQKKAAALSSLYWQAARFECGLDPGPIEAVSQDAGLALVQQVVISRCGDTAQRESARAQLRARIKGRPEPWVEAWCRAALGRSLLREDSAELKRLGVVELLHVPARLADECPYLTGVAMADAAVAMLSLGDRAGADRLRAELRENYPGHPASDWAPIVAWPASPHRPPDPVSN